MKKQIVQAAGNSNQTGNEQADTAAIDPSFSEGLFCIQIPNGGIDHRIAQC